ncbi:MAG: MBL fold metallo-hydrolase [Actinomycetota bacterium]
MRITVLGKSPSWQDAGGACSGYLVQEGATTLLLDCGNGVFSKLRTVWEYSEVDAVVVSHMHADHFLDLVPYAYGLTYGQESAARPALYLPVGGRKALRRIVGCWGSEDLIETAFDLSEYDAADTIEVGPLQLRFCAVKHFIDPTHAVQIKSTNGPGRFTFGADTAPCDDLAAFAKGSDLLFLEATIEVPESDGKRGHMTAGEAGQQALQAGAARLVLTHLSDELDQGAALLAAQETFGGEVEIAAEGAVYEL